MWRAVTLYAPGTRPGNAYEPSAWLFVVRDTPLCSFRASIAAPPSGAPLASFTYPRMLPVLVCEKAAGAAKVTRTKLRNSPRPSCANDGLRLMSASPVSAFALVITHLVQFVKSASARVD